MTMVDLLDVHCSVMPDNCAQMDRVDSQPTQPPCTQDHLLRPFSRQIHDFGPISLSK